MKLLDTNRFYLKGTNNRFLHLASISEGLKEYMCFADVKTSKLYIEQITGGHLEFIDDDILAKALFDYLEYSGVLDMKKPLLPNTKPK